MALQNTLLGLAIAIILALVAALVGPLLIDWGSHRAFFESEASRLLGAKVHIAGAIDARLLPTPQLTLRDILVDGDNMHTRSLGVEFALGPLLRGQWRASELTLIGPKFGLSLDANGRVQMPVLAVSFEPDSLAIERLTIVDGTLVLTDAVGGGSATLEQLSFKGDARSLLGPVKGEGDVTIAGERMTYHVATGRYGDDDAIKLRLTIEPSDRPLTMEADGVLALAEGVPRFEGNLTLARAVGIATQANTINQPWRLTAKVTANAQSSLMKNLDFQYGSEEQGFKLSGDADLQFGKTPHLKAVLSGSQIDLDRALSADSGERPQVTTAVRNLAELMGGAFEPRFPIQIGIAVDQIALGGGTVQNLRGDLSTDASGWVLDRFEFRAPGFTQARVGGRLTVGKDGIAFVGPADISSDDPNALAAWLSGTGDVTPAKLWPLSLRGEVTLASDEIAFERIAAEIDRKPVSGRLVYGFARQDRPARLEVEANAPTLDLDAALGFGNALLAGATIDKPHDVTIGADVGRVAFMGFAARDVSVRMKVDGDGWQIDRLAVADLGGAAFSASGHIVATGPAPRGTMRCDLDLSEMTPVVALLGHIAPEVAQAIGSVAPAMAPAKLRARLSIDGAAQRTQAKLDIDGSLGKVRLALNGQTEADPVAFSLGDIRLSAKLDSDDGKALVAMLGLDRLVMVAPGPAILTATAIGPLHGDFKFESLIKAGTLDANLDGIARPFADKPSATARVAIVNADMAPLRGSASSLALPVALTARIELGGNNLSLADISATMAGAVLRGRLDYSFAKPYHLRGEIDADQIDAGGLIAATIGVPMSPSNAYAASAWPSEPFGQRSLADYTGEILLKAKRLDLMSKLTARDIRATLRFDQSGNASFDDVNGDIGGGHLAGLATFERTNVGIKAHAKLSIVGADAADLIAVGSRPVAGTLGFAGEAEGAGLSPAALIAALHGAATFTLDDGQVAGLDPRVFETVTRAVDRGLPIEVARIANAAGQALASGPFPVKHMEATVVLGAGRARLATVSSGDKDVTLSMSGSLDLAAGSIDANAILSGATLAAGTRPQLVVTLNGPIGSPSQTVDSAALTGWLTLRAVDMQTKQLRDIERATPQSMDAPAPALPAPIEIRPAPAPMRSMDPPASLRLHD